MTATITPTPTPTAGAERAATWTLDPAHTLVEFAVKHMMITTVKGRLADVRGTILIDPVTPAASTVEVELGAASIDTRSEQRDGHLRSPDFLDAERFPAILFRSRRVEGAEPRDGSRFRLVGDLTIRGVTREIALDATFDGRGRDPWGGERVSFSAAGAIDRREFGLVWNQALESGGLLVGTEVKINVEAQAVRS
jgi:polyisoprenoid-binding protein YceI